MKDNINQRHSRNAEINEKDEDMTDNINPAHYTSGKVECIDALEAATHQLTGIEAVCTANAIKYLWRWKQKNGVEDLRKARWYLDRLIGAQKRRDPRDVASDPEGKLIHDPAKPLVAAKPAKTGRDLYSDYAFNHAAMHCCRLPFWGELSNEEQADWNAKAKAQESDWIEWNGGVRPVVGRQFVFVKLANGEVSERAVEAASLYWGRAHMPSDIIAYRTAKEAA